MLIKSVLGKKPLWGKDCFIADNATLIGDIVIGDHCSVWFNTVIRGDVNKIRIGKKIFYIRPENIKIVKHSKLSIKADKCFFQGKDYKIIGSYNNNIWSVFSKEPVKVNTEIFIEYLEEDLIYFDERCSGFFT